MGPVEGFFRCAPYSPMLERHLTFTVAKDRQSAFEDFMVQEYAPVLEAFPKCVGVRILRASSDGQYRIVGTFESEAAEKEWRASAEHNLLSPRLRAFFSEYVLEYFTLVGPAHQ